MEDVLMNVRRCPLCNRKITLFNQKKMTQIMRGLLSEKKVEESKKRYPSYSEIVDEVVTWSLYQEKHRKYSAPVDIRKRIEVVACTLTDKKLSQAELSLLTIHVNDILSLIKRYPDALISKNYDIKRIYFDDKPYLGRKV